VAQAASARAAQGATVLAAGRTGSPDWQRAFLMGGPAVGFEQVAAAPGEDVVVDIGALEVGPGRSVAPPALPRIRCIPASLRESAPWV
jgi:hypothetical protein